MDQLDPFADHVILHDNVTLIEVIRWVKEVQVFNKAFSTATLTQGLIYKDRYHPLHSIRAKQTVTDTNINLLCQNNSLSYLKGDTFVSHNVKI